MPEVEQDRAADRERGGCRPGKGLDWVLPPSLLPPRMSVQLAFELPTIDLVISNTKVQGIDGVALIQRLRKDRPNCL